MADSLRKLAAQLARVTSDVESLKRWASTPQLPASSLDDASVPEKDAAGNIVSRWGRQEDGTHGVVIFDGPTPPVPAGLEAEDGAGVVTAVWGGTYAGDVGKLDFHAVEIYVAPEPFQYIEEATLVGAIPDPDGGRVTFGRAPGTWHIGAVTLSQAGKRSPVSALVTAEATRVADSADLERLEGAFTTSTEPPTAADGQGKPEDAYWTQVDAEGAQVARWRWNGHQWVPAPLGVQFIPEAYMDYLATNAAFVGELASNTVLADEVFAQNLNMTGELAALSDDFTTVLSQSGLKMFANNSLELEQQWEVTGAPTSGAAQPAALTSNGDYLYALIPATGGTWENPNQIRRYDLNGNTLENIDSATGWRFFSIAANATHLYALAEQTGQVIGRERRIERRDLDGALLDSIPAGSAFPNERVTRFAPLDNGDIAVAIIGPEYQRIELWDPAGNVIRVLEEIPTANWSVQHLAADDQHVYYYMSFGWVGAPRYVRQYTHTGTLVRDIHLPSWPSSLSTSGDTLWIGLQQTGLLVAYNTGTGSPAFISKLADGDQQGNLQANNGHIYGINAFWNAGPVPVIYRYSIRDEPNVRVNIDNFQGKMTSEELEVRGWQVTPSTKHYIRGPDIFASLEPGISVASSSLAVIDEAEDGSTVTMSVSIIGIDRSAGNQQISIGTLHPDLAPGLAVVLPGYYTNGAVTAAITSVGNVSLRWSSGSSSIQIFFSTSYAIDRGE